ncbi:FN3 associated domain-containing protein [Costertonia aggregata]|uniref:Chitobiase/beta-hexosaminidase C-terminal domain-containing protein n=1 Tax=Costertonia aggregata TaxID=343403 RepID=A0A7H9AKK3_9FLAO|nr:FN3 associated domain-containing protein [Costertonia aggregata]QLG43980.1 chitobiase/beta-hexosaminidase C-terminal domain-containing protein [Costertonia aggregata]
MTYLMINIGNFHPVLVHLPIGILIFAFILEIYQRLKPDQNIGGVIKLAIGFGVLSALASIGTGLLLESNGAYDEELLFRHKWMAISLTAVTIILFFAKEAKQAVLAKLYFPLFILANVMLTLAGHWGGSMTHGEDFLTKDTSKAKKSIEDVDKALVYNDIVQPIFDAKCVSCHNTKKTEGKLLLTSQAEILKGGDSGSILDSTETRPPMLVHRIALPMEDEEHMPPKGKVQLTPNEVALLNWWIANNNCFDCITADLERNKRVQGFLNDLEEDTSTRAVLARQLEPAPDVWLNTVLANGISILSLKEESPLYMVNLSNKKTLSKNSFELLNDYAENIVEMNLGNSNFHDSLATEIRSFKNLTKLQLHNTGITDEALEFTEDLTLLESLNLYGTQVTNTVMDRLRQLPNLTDLYIWQTSITNDAIHTFKTDKVATTVHEIDDDIFGETELLPPTIIADSYFIMDSLTVEMSYPFEDTQMFYTLDGSVPDTTSLVYTQPIVLKDRATIKAITYKTGWGKSDVVSSDFKKSTLNYDKVALNKLPNEKYAAQGGTTLVDLKRGSNNFVDGNWLGYEGTHFNATFALAEKQDISSVSVGALSVPGSWIFFPVGFKVSVSDDGKRFTHLHTVDLGPLPPTSTISSKFFDIEFPKTTAKYVRVEVKSVLENPSWHQNPGGKSWLFVDEIVIN